MNPITPIITSITDLVGTITAIARPNPERLRRRARILDRRAEKALSRSTEVKSQTRSNRHLRKYLALQERANQLRIDADKLAANV
jgi:hypothetical protein